MTFREHGRRHLQSYLALRRARVNQDQQKRNLRDWISAVAAKLTVEELELVLISIYTMEDRYDAIVVEDLAKKDTVEMTQVINRIQIEDK